MLFLCVKHHAIVASGGYENVAEMLELHPLSSKRYKRRSVSSVHRQTKTLFVAARKRFGEDWEGSCQKGDFDKKRLASDVVKSIKMTFYLEKQLVARVHTYIIALSCPRLFFFVNKSEDKIPALGLLFWSGRENLPCSLLSCPASMIFAREGCSMKLALLICWER